MRPHLRRLHPRALLSPRCPALALRPSPPLLCNSQRVFTPVGVTIQTRQYALWDGLITLFGGKFPDKASTPAGYEILRNVHTHYTRKFYALPEVVVIVDALNNFLSYLNGRTLSPDQALIVKTVYIHLQNAQPGRLPVPQETIVQLVRCLGGGLPIHVELAKIAFADLTNFEGFKPTMRNVGPYAVALKAGGEVDELLELCAALSHLQVEGKQLGLWDIGMAAAANTGDEQLVLKTLKDAVAAPSFMGMKERVYEIMISFYCERGELEKAREWYNKAVDEGNVPPPSTMVAMLKACIRNGRMEYGDEMLNTLKKKIISPEAASETNKEAWDTALAFTVAQGKGVAGLALTFAEMEKFIEDHPGACPPVNTTTLNTILRVAVECHDIDVVRELEEYFKNHQDVDPSLETYQLFLQNALEIPDLPRAVSFFEDIRFNVARFPKQYEAIQEQQLLIALASQSPPSLQQIQEIYTDLMQWRVKLFPSTVLKLLEIHLLYNDMDGIRSFVLSHVGYLTAADRQKVIEILMAHCFADSTSIQTCWETYLIMANHLPELSVEQRHAFIDFFFEHDNPHVATKVLTHMTIARDPDRMPNRDTYVKAFLHLAVAQDQTSLQTTHKRLSMDARVNADTELYNYLLLAAARSSLYTKAWIIYEDIARSKEGPDSATFNIVWGELCKRDKADGFRTALAIWNRCRRNRVQLTDRNLASFVEALAWHHRWGEAFERIKQAEDDLDEDGKSWITVGPRTIGTLFSTAVPNTHPPSPTFPKPDFSDSEIMPPLPLDNILYNWYNAKHPELWEQLQQAMRKPAPDHRRLTIDDINPYKDVPDEEVMERFFSGGFIREHWRYEASVEMLLEDFRSMRVVKLMNI